MKELIIILNQISTYQGFFLGLILVNRKENKFSNNILSAILFSSALKSFAIDLYLKGLTLPVYLLSFILFPLSFLYGPLIYFYTISMTGKINRFNKKHIYHFLPSLLACLIFLFINICYYFNNQITIKDTSTFFIFSYLRIIIIVYNTTPLIVILYTMISWKILNRYYKDVMDYFSNNAGLRILWLKNFLGIIFILFLSSVIASWLFIIKMKLSLLSQYFLIINFCFMVIIAFFLLRKPDIFKYTHEMLEEFTETIEIISEIYLKEEKRKYEKNDIGDRKKDEYRVLLLNWMKEKKPYLKEDITLKNLADELSIPPHHLSIVINERFKQNFYSFINSYRVSDVIEKLNDPANSEKNILNLAYESGFNSKSTFNMAFKNITGKTPTEYKKSINN